jgi:hypothetical protein
MKSNAIRLVSGLSRGFYLSWLLDKNETGRSACSSSRAATFRSLSRIHTVRGTPAARAASENPFFSAGSMRSKRLSDFELAELLRGLPRRFLMVLIPELYIPKISKSSEESH